MSVGHNLRTLRERVRLTIRDVEQATHRIATVKNDKRFAVSNSWLTRLERGKSEPSIYKVYSLSIVYNVALSALLKVYGIDVSETVKLKPIAQRDLTQLLSSEVVNEAEDEVQQKGDATKLLTQASGIRIELPIGERTDLTSQTIAYGYIGLHDYTMYPLIRPGAIVRIDPRQTRPSLRVHTEYDRPIYFIELRGGYACGWCEIEQSQLTIIPHQSSPVRVRHYAYPKEAEIVGRVISFDTICTDRDTA